MQCSAMVPTSVHPRRRQLPELCRIEAPDRSGEGSRADHSWLLAVAEKVSQSWTRRLDLRHRGPGIATSGSTPTGRSCQRPDTYRLARTRVTRGGMNTKISATDTPRRIRLGSRERTGISQMWGDIRRANNNLLRTHLALTDRLADMTWSKVQIWDSRTSVHQYSIGNVSLAYDTTQADSLLTTHLVVRQKTDYPKVANALSKEGVVTTRHERDDGRFRIHEVSVDAPDALDTTESAIRTNRKQLTQSLINETKWTDKTTGLNVVYSVKQERGGCDEIIFLFTSIRGKQHWIDFDGANGDSLSPNRARIVFIQDDFGAQYTYNFAYEGKTHPATATTNFIRSYIDDHGYSPQKTTLAGMSKGGTSAIVAGAALRQCTIVALAPQLSVGSYLHTSGRHQIAKQMAPPEQHGRIRTVNNLLWDYLTDHSEHWGIETAYILTSENDPHCTNDLWRLASYFRGSSSSHIYTHTTSSSKAHSHFATVQHLIPLFLSLLGVISFGLRPSI